MSESTQHPFHLTHIASVEPWNVTHRIFNRRENGKLQMSFATLLGKHLHRAVGDPQRQIWKSFTFQGEDSTRVLMMSASGVELLREDPSLINALKDFKTESLVEHEILAGGTRDAVEGFVFGVKGNDKIVVKSLTQNVQLGSAGDRLFRMERLRFLRELVNVPEFEHVQIPKHYAAVTTRNFTTEQLVIERVSGPSALHVVAEGSPYSEEQKNLVIKAMNEALVLLEKISEKIPSNEDPNGLIRRERHRKNFIIDFSQPRGSYPFTLWIIDQ